MGLIIRKKKNMTRILISNSTCPYCEFKFQKPPSRKAKCPSCNKIIYVRTGTDRNRYLITEDETAIFKQEWVAETKNRNNGPNRTEEEYEELLKMPLRFTINKSKQQGSMGQIPIRWVLGSWCKKHCRRIAGYPSCADLQGDYDSLKDLPTLPAAQTACQSDEFSEWWDDHYHVEKDCFSCDCHLELSFDGGKSFHRITN